MTAKPTNVRWQIFALACATSWILYLHRYTWSFIRPALAEEYGFNNQQLEAIYTAFNITYGIGQIPSGLLCDFVGPHLFLGVIIVVWSLVIPTFALTGNYGMLSALRLVFGAAQAGAYPALSNVTRSWFPLDSRSIAQGWIASFFGRMGGALAPIILGTLLMGLMGLSLKVSLLVMGLAGAVFGLAFLMLFRNSPDQDYRVNEAERELIRKGTVSGEGEGRVLPMGRVLRNRSMYFFVVQTATSAGADVIYVSLMGSYFLDAKGLDLARAGLAASLPLFGGALGGMFGGYCNDWLIRATGSRRWSRKIVGFAGKFVACLLMFVTIQQADALAAGACLFAVKFFTDWSQPTVWGTCTDLGGRYSATVFSIINTSGTAGSLVSPLGFGWLLDRYATTHVIGGATVLVTNYEPVFITVAIMYVVSACCWVGIDSTESLEREPSV